MTNLNCPNCKRHLGETNKSIDAVLLCKGCKQKVHIKIDSILTADYFNFKEEK